MRYNNRLLHTHNVAKRMGLSPRTVRWWAKNKRAGIPAHRGPGRRAWAFYADEVEAWFRAWQTEGGHHAG
jgi:excisionase family DNA binding protein